MAAAAAAKAAVVLPRPVTFVTGNAKKLEEVKAIIGSSIPFKSLKLDRAYPPFRFQSRFLFSLNLIHFTRLTVELQCLSFKESLRISPKRKLVWLLFRSTSCYPFRLLVLIEIHHSYV